MSSVIFCVIVLLWTLLFGFTRQTGIIVCHDCSGLEECDWLLENKWTGRCQALVTGKCFIRRDPNGLLYRGCADSLNWPHALDLTYNGCKYQTYGEWSDKPVYWCFCDHSLCNVNISYILYSYPSSPSTTGLQPPPSQDATGQVSQGQLNQGWYVADEGPRQPEAVPPLVYMLPPGTPPAGKELLPRPIVVDRQPGGAYYNTDWEAVLRYIKQVQFNNGAGAVPVTIPQSASPGRLPPVLPPYIDVVPLPPSSGGYYTPRFPAVQQPVTTPPSIKTIPPQILNVTGGQRYTNEQLIGILNSLLSELGLSTITPGVRQPGGQLVFDLPTDVLTYLQTNLPRGASSVQSLPYPLYIILYLLSVSGYNINSILPGTNVTGSDILPPMAGDLLPPTSLTPTRTNLDAVCPADFIKQPSLGSCYKIFTARSEARPVSQSRDHCKQLSRLASLVSVETVQEKVFLAGLLRQEPVMLEGWQGWWTSGAYRDGVNQFFWETGQVIPNTGDFWGFQRPPFRDTCVWVLQIPNYNYTLANYDCLTASGHICEISLANLNTNTNP